LPFPWGRAFSKGFEKTVRRRTVNVYECIVILNAELADESVEASLSKIRDLIAANGGEVLKTDPWGRRRMAYEISKHQRGNYILLLFRAPSATVKKLEDLFKVTDTVVKFMVIKLEKKMREAALKSVVVEAPAESPAQPSQPAEAKEG